MKKYTKKLFTLFVSALMLVFSVPKISCERAGAVEDSDRYTGNYTYFFCKDRIEYNNMLFGQAFQVYTNKKGPFMFMGCLEGVADAVVPEYVDGHRVEGISDYALASNKYIRNVTLPDSIYYFGQDVFYDSSAETVNIPKSLKVIPDQTFRYCENLKEVTFHDDILVCGSLTFDNTNFELPDWLREKGEEYEDENYIIDSSSNFKMKYGDYDLLITPYDFGKTICATLLDFPIESGDVTIPDNVNVFPITGCNFKFSEETMKSITSLTTPPTVKKIKMDFESAKNLKKLDIQGENAVLLAKDKLDTLASFKYSNIEEINLNSPETLNSENFCGCKTLKKINITGQPKNIDIKNDAFKDCTSLTEINIPENCDVHIYSNAFANTSLSKITINGNLQTGIGSFSGCKDLSEITVTGDADLGRESFKNCFSLKELSIGGNLTAEWKVFSECPLENININTSYDVDGSLFSGCKELKSINSIFPVDSDTGELIPELDEYIRRNFGNAEKIGFLDDYVKARVKKIVAENITPDMPDIQKVKILHDWICNNTTYNNDDKRAFVQNSSDCGIFLCGSAQCQGYSNTYDLLLQEAGIESYTVGNNTHAWNIVKLGGHYFHIDSTWDDSDNISYNWFLKPDQKVKNEKNNHSFWELYKNSDLHSFVLDKVPECEYSIGDVNMDSNTNIADLVSLQRHVLGQSAIAPDDQILGDLCGDGVLDGFDIVKMRRKLIN